MKIRKLPEPLQKKAIEELNEVPSRIEDDIKHIREWIKKQPHLSIRTDDQHILTFLRGCKFSLQKTKEKLDFFYAIRAVVPEFFEDRDSCSKELQHIFESGAIMKLPQTLGSYEPPIIMLHWRKLNVETMPLVSILKAVLMFVDIYLNEDDNMIVSGVRFMSDMADFPTKYALQFTPGLIKKFVLCIENAYPIRIKAVYAVNAPSIFNTIWAVVKPLTSQKFNSRLRMFKEEDVEKFYALNSKDCLPKEYGGTQPPFSDIADECLKKVESYKKWFLDDAQYCSDERLRGLQSKSLITNLINMEGSFRKLNID